jgi:hypothetical protein
MPGAETIFALSQIGVTGSVRMPERERDARDLKLMLDARLAALAEKANHLARSRTNDERKVADLAGLLQHWMLYGKPKGKAEKAA